MHTRQQHAFVLLAVVRWNIVRCKLHSMCARVVRARMRLLCFVYAVLPALLIVRSLLFSLALCERIYTA